MIHNCFKPKFYKKCKSRSRYMKIRIDTVRKKRNAMVKFLKMDIVDFLKNGYDYNAYTRAEVLLEELRILSCYDFIEKFCDCVIENLSLMAKKRECPEECREAVSSLIFATAWVPDVPELKDLREIFTYKYGNSTDYYVNHEMIKKVAPLKVSRETKIQTVQETANEFSIKWDPKTLQLMLLKQTQTESSTLQIEDNNNGNVNDVVHNDDDDDDDDDANMMRKKRILNDESDDESNLSKDSLFEINSSSSSNSSSIRKSDFKGLDYDEVVARVAKGKEEENTKLVEQENSRLLGSQDSISNVMDETSSFRRQKLLEYDDVVARLTSIGRRYK